MRGVHDDGKYCVYQLNSIRFNHNSNHNHASKIVTASASTQRRTHPGAGRRKARKAVVESYTRPLLW